MQALSNDSIQRLTALGRHLSNLPVDVHIGKMLLFGAIFQCLDPILTIAAAMSFKSPFVRPFGKEDEADRARLGFRRGNVSYTAIPNSDRTFEHILAHCVYLDNSDFSTIYNAYLGWRMRLSGQVRPGGYKAAKEYCKKHYLSFQNLEMIEDMKKQFLGLLVNIGFVHMDKKELASEVNRYRVKRLDRFCIVPKQYDMYGGDITVINAAIAAALYPKFAFIAKHTQKLVHGPTQEIVHIHPSSILYRAREHTSANFMVFNTITKSDKVYLWDVTTVDDIAIMLFGGDMDILVRAGRGNGELVVVSILNQVYIGGGGGTARAEAGAVRSMDKNQVSRQDGCYLQVPKAPSCKFVVLKQRLLFPSALILTWLGTECYPQS